LHPKFYLIKPGLSESDIQRVKAALDIAPPVGVFVFSPEGAEEAKKLTDAPAIGTEAPLAILANICEHPLAVIDEAGNILHILIEGTETNGEHADTPADSKLRSDAN
jgi:hypothetical protein